MASSVVNICAVALFALFMPFGFFFGEYLASIFIAFSFVPLVCALTAQGRPEAKVAGHTAAVFAGMYAVVNILVYFAQVTTLRLESLNEQATALLDYSAFSLFFNYDLLGYCFMAVATFFAGTTIEVRTKSDKALRWLLLIHGVFAVSCFIMPMTGVFNPGMSGAVWIGTVVLEVWCAYFIPVGVLAFLHFRSRS
jgi:hypothetical protein